MEAQLTFLTTSLQNSSGDWQYFVGLPLSSTHDHELSPWKTTFDKFNLFSYNNIDKSLCCSSKNLKENWDSDTANEIRESVSHKLWKHIESSPLI